MVTGCGLPHAQESQLAEPHEQHGPHFILEGVLQGCIPEPVFPYCFAGSMAADEVVLMYLTAQPSASDAAGFDLPRQTLRY